MLIVKNLENINRFKGDNKNYPLWCLLAQSFFLHIWKYTVTLPTYQARDNNTLWQ